jgi:hypothetical protein
LPTNTLDALSQVRTVTYNWKTGTNTRQQIGFLAQDLQLYFPDLVATDNEGFLSVYYSQMTPILTEAIRELNMKVTAITDLTTPNNSFVAQLIAWLGNSANGITNIFTHKVTTDELCVGSVCVTQDQFLHMVQGGNSSGSTTGSSTTGGSTDGTTTGSDITPSDPAGGDGTTGSTDTSGTTGGSSTGDSTGTSGGDTGAPTN